VKNSQLKSLKNVNSMPHIKTLSIVSKTFRFILLFVVAIFLLNFTIIVSQVKERSSPICSPKLQEISWRAGEFDDKKFRLPVEEAIRTSVPKPPVFVILQRESGFNQSSDLTSHHGVVAAKSLGDAFSQLNVDYCETFIIAKDVMLQTGSVLETSLNQSQKNIGSNVQFDSTPSVSMQLKRLWFDAYFGDLRQFGLNQPEHMFDTLRIVNVADVYPIKTNAVKLMAVEDATNGRRYGIICQAKVPSRRPRIFSFFGYFFKEDYQWLGMVHGKMARLLKRTEIVNDAMIEARLCGFFAQSDIQPIWTLIPSFLSTNWRIETRNTPLRRILLDFDFWQIRYAKFLARGGF
jgi:hypothetical protein